MVMLPWWLSLFNSTATGDFVVAVVGTLTRLCAHPGGSRSWLHSGACTIVHAPSDMGVMTQGSGPFCRWQSTFVSEMRESRTQWRWGSSCGVVGFVLCRLCVAFIASVPCDSAPSQPPRCQHAESCFQTRTRSFTIPSVVRTRKRSPIGKQGMRGCNRAN